MKEPPAPSYREWGRCGRPPGLGSKEVTMNLTSIRRVLLACAVLVGLALGSIGCEHDHHDDDIAVTVHNSHPDTIFIEAIDGSGFATDLGNVLPGEIVTFVIGDYWVGRPLHARCTCDGAVISVEYAYDGLHWDVP
jgi:hypothetical protein